MPANDRLSPFRPEFALFSGSRKMYGRGLSVPVCFHITDRNFRLYESGYVVTLSIAERGIYGISGRIRLAAPNIRVDMALYSGTAPTVETLTLKVARYTPACGCPDSGAACPVFWVCLRIPGRTVRSDTAGLRGHMSYRDYMDNP